MGRALKVTGYDQNSALKRIKDMLEDAFNDVGEKIRVDLLKAYRKNAKHNYDKFIEAAEHGVGEIVPRGDKYSRFHSWHDYVHVDYRGSKSLGAHFIGSVYTWEHARRLKDFIHLSYERAEERANASYESARDSFVYKNLGKLSTVIGKRQDLKNAVIKFDWRGNYFKGNLQIYLEDAYFRGDVDIKYVVREIPRVTPYFQYPLVFIEAEIAGKHYQRPSEDELRILLGATKSAVEEKREAAIASGICPMSGQPVPAELLKGLYNRMAVYVRCPTCKAVASVNKQSWNFRSHKTPGAERAGAAQKLETAGYCRMSREKAPAEIVAAMGPVEPYKDPKGFCPACKQQVRLDARKEWIPVAGGGYPTQMKVESATYYKHKLTK